MNEQNPITPEEHFLPKYEHLEALPNVADAEPLRKGEADPLKLKEAREAVEHVSHHDNPIESLKAAERAQKTPQPTYINQALKDITLQRELRQLRRKLPIFQRNLSKIVHQQSVSVVSEAASKSISRPSGMLGGGVVAFFGSSFYFYLSKHIGFTYNYMVFIVLFLGGFILGLGLETIIWVFTLRHRQGKR